MIEWVISSSILILVVLAVRTVGKNKLSCRMRYALWLLVLVRLLVPVQLFATSWGMPARELPYRYTVKSLGYERYAELELPTNGFDDAGKPVFESAEAQEQWDSFLNHGPEGVPQGSGMEAGVSADTASAVWYDYRWSVEEVLRAVWLTGAGVMAAILLVSNLRFVCGLKRRRMHFDAPDCEMETYVADGLTSPCLAGLFRPAVYLTPESTRDERMLRHVLAHETTHWLHGDSLWSLLRLAALCLHWYNPLAWYAAIVSKRDGELACDEATLARLGEDERTAYGETLLALVRAKPNTRELLSASTAMTAGKKPMRERIETIAKHPRTRTLALILALVVLLTSTAFAFSKSAIRNPYVREYVPGDGVSRGNVDAAYFLSRGEAYAIGAGADGTAVFKDPQRAWKAFTTDYADAIRRIRAANQLLPLTRATMSMYLTYGWQTEAATPQEAEENDFVSRFLDIYENSFEEPRTDVIDVPPTAEARTGDYPSVEEYVDFQRAQMTVVSYYPADGSDMKTAGVRDTRVAVLDKAGELSGLAPEGTLELYSYLIETKLEVPAEDIIPVGGMYVLDDGWCELEGQGGRALIVLRYTDDSVTVLRDAPRNDDWGGINTYEDTVEEMLYDWYVREQGLDLPLYAIDLPSPDGESSYPAHRADGDGWYLYVPIQAWYRTDVDGVTRFGSRYDTGSVLSVRRSSRAEMDADHPRLEAGQTASYIAAPTGEVWLVSTRYDPAKITDYPEIAIEPDVLEAMANSFTPDARFAARSAAADEGAFFSIIAGDYLFLSGAGAWRTELHIQTDGTFTGYFQDADNNVINYCDFAGRFGGVTQMNEYTYSMHVWELTTQLSGDAQASGEHVRVAVSHPHGMENADELLVYLPGTPVDELPEEFLRWYCAGLPYGKAQLGDTLPAAGLYNVSDEYAFFLESLLELPVPGDAEKLRDFAQKLNDERMSVTLSLYDGGWKGSYEGSNTSNSWGYANVLTNCSFVGGPDEPPASGRYVRLETLGCRLDFYGNFVLFRDQSGTERGYWATYREDVDYLVEQPMREWYDEAEFGALRGSYDRQDEIVIPDRGQSYLEAAQAHCEIMENTHLQVSDGSKYRYTYVKPIVSAAEEETAWFRQNGNIQENQWAIYLTVIFVPENEPAFNWSMAGNTGDYAESVQNPDPDVPEGALVCLRVGYVTKETDGWHTSIVGTGW